jgi:hypothetical protein
MVLAARSISTGNAIVLLCQNGHANEALPLLRLLAEFALMMRWVVAADAPTRAQSIQHRLAQITWDNLLTPTQAAEKASEWGLPTWIFKLTFDSALNFVRGNAQGLPWGHVFADGALTDTKSDDVQAVTAVWLSLVMEALDRRWPGDFPGASELRDAVQILRG